jgi:tRNA (guanine-N7-)-methyltransferase
LAGLFGSPRELWLEVGFGAGEHLVWQAEHHPDVGLIGCEPFINGVAKCLAHIERTGVSNVRLFTDDARLVMAALPDRSLSRAFVLFPDPWPKTRHHKRRFVQRENLDTLARLLKAGAELRLATDDPSYLPWMVEHACTHPAFAWLADRPSDWRGRPDDWPATRYEEKMLAGHQPVFLRLRRV